MFIADNEAAEPTRSCYQKLILSVIRCYLFHLEEAYEILVLQLKLINLGYVREPQELEIFKGTTDLADLTEERKKKIAECLELLTKG